MCSPILAAPPPAFSPGDLIHSANGYLTQTAGNLTWIINHQATNGTHQSGRPQDGQWARR